jgi:mono/diheme cytochrome c family protein
MMRIVPATLPPSGHPTYVQSPMMIEAQRLARALPPEGTVERVIAQRCAACHGSQLRVTMPQEIINNHWRYPMDDNSLRSIIKDGIKEKGMPASRDLSDFDISSLIARLRESSKKD